MSFSSSINLSSLNGTNGFRLDGVSARDGSGASVASAGDVNGDGFADLIVGAPWTNLNGDYVGASYVVFSKSSGVASAINLSTLDGTTGFRLDGVSAGDNSGYSVASAGDVNGDGYADLIVGAYQADPNGINIAGSSYVVFGKSSAFASSINLSTLDGTTGFRLDGVSAGDNSGYSVASAGDVNGDGFADLIIGAPGRDRGSLGWNADSGASYVVFGKASGFDSAINLSTLDGITGFRVVGNYQGDLSGASVASAGDVNGDGFADLIIGAYGSQIGNDNFVGSSYVLFGRSVGFYSSYDFLVGGKWYIGLAFSLFGVTAGDRTGFSVASAGDVNGDGFADLIIGAPGAGASYVVFGKSSGWGNYPIALSTLNGSTGFRIDGVTGGDNSGNSVAPAGDLNGDGFADLIIGAPGGGASYVVFGKSSSFNTAINLSTLNGTNGFKLNGGGGNTVASAGDVNGDGFADLIIGAPVTDPSSNNSGSSYVYFSPATGGATYRGTTLADRLHGTAFADIMNGNAGNDTITGGAGNDTIDGGGGNDTVIWATGDGSDTITLGTGNNIISFSGNGFTYIDNGAQRAFTIGSATVTVTDWTAGSNSVAFYNRMPSVTSPGSTNFAENTNDTAYQASGSSPDANATLTYLLGGVDAALFNINAASGVVTFKASPDFEAPADTGGNNVYDITVTASDGSLSSAAKAVAITVTNVDESSVSIAATSASKAEGNTGTTSYTFTATRTGDTSVAHTAAWAVTGSGVNAAAAADFVGAALPAGTVSFAIGETSKTITIDVAGDTLVETDEGFTVTLSSPSTGLVLGTSTASGSIINDDSLLGTPNADTLTGSAANDTLNGLGGNDVIDGGAGTDLALFSGVQAAYRFALDGAVLIVSGPDGTDRLSSVETLSFGGATPVLVSNLQGFEPFVTVQTGGVSTKVLPDRYVGPVDWLEYQTLGTTNGDVVIGTSRNDFFNLLGGDDAANGGAGDDVIDGGTGSNFLSGGAGRDDFFLDGRGGSTTWATITDWSEGERLSVWGWRPGVSKVQWVDSAGAPGWTGVTMHGDLNGNGVIDTSVTWTGLTRSQLPTPLEFDGLLWFT